MRVLTYLGPQSLEWRAAPDPKVEGAAQAIVRPIASAPCDLDRAIVGGKTPLPPPFALGHECAAEVVEVGDGVRRFKPGDRVVVPWHISCGACGRCRRGLPASCEAVTPRAMYGVPLGGDWGGLFSELVRVPYADSMLVAIPPGVSAAVAAGASDNITDAMIAVRRTYKPGSRVAVVGGTGAIALFAVDFARAAGATDILYIDRNEERLSLARELGATRALDRATAGKEDLGEFGAVIDASGNPAELMRAIRLLAPGGACHSVGVYFMDAPLPLLDMYAKDITFSTGRPSVGPHMAEALAMVAAGQVHPEKVISEAPWDDAPTVLTERRLKPVLVRA